MDGNSSLERRYSFNIAQCNPVAESTQLNGSSFSWGYSMSPRQRSNSNMYLNNSHCDNSRTSVVSPKSKNITKIDARIAADVQSKGLASRIVKYHESGTRLNRSMSAHNLYSKPGQFPVVTLKKTDLPYRATRQELSMIRIAPPEKSTFYGNPISSLLRSNSVVGLQRRTEDISRENRPIIHPPPSENDMAPTRSVLDVLKEISRKRINSDDLDTDETTKKCCNRSGSDFVDISNGGTTPANVSNIVTSAGQRFKRQRDGNTPQQSAHLLDTKTSPEQAKKRVCNYNNDITSSLSSSMKCKLYEKKRSSYNLNQTMPANLEPYEIQKSKIQRYHDHYNNTQDDMRFENLANNLRKVDTIKPITPIPATPSTQDQSCNAVPPQRSMSEPQHHSVQKAAMTSVHPANKPRLTLFNKKYDEAKETNDSEAAVEDSKNDLNAFGECAGISFVKPKKISSITGLKNPAIERTQKSKLALMLSGLRGELYQSSERDELDSSKDEKEEKTEDNKIISTAAVILASKSVGTTTTTVTSSSSSVASPMSNAAETTTTTTTLSSTANTITTSSLANASTNKTSPLVGLKMTPPKSQNYENSITPGVDTIKTTETQSKPNIPVLGGFSFSTNASLPAVVQTTTINTDPKVSNTITTTATTATTNGVLQFGQLTQSPTTTTTTTINNNTNSFKLPTMNLNAPSSIKDNLLPFPVVCSASNVLSNNTSTSSSSTNLTSTSLLNSSNVLNSLKSPPAFTFGTNPMAPISTSSVSTPMAGAAAPLNSSAKSNTTFNFLIPSTSTPANTNTASTATMVFGSFPSSAATTKPTSSNILSIAPNTANSTSSSAPTFGVANVTTNSLTSTSTSFTFKPPNQSTNITASNSSSIVSSGPFSFGSNPIASDAPVIKTQTSSSPFSFGSEPKTQQQTTTVVDTNKTVLVNQTENPGFGSNTPSFFGSPSFNAPSNSVFGGTPSNSSEKNIFGASNGASSTSFFGVNSTKTSSQTFGSSVDNKITSAFGGSNTNSSNAATPFTFGSKPAMANTTNNTNNNTDGGGGGGSGSGGFSFGSVTSNSPQTFGFGGSKSSGSSNPPSNAATLQNKTFTFGNPANKIDNNCTNVFGGVANKPPENTGGSSGGFSFGSSVAQKTSTFSFGGNSFSGSNVGTNNSSNGFAFGGAATSKPTEISTSKPFSFGTPQTQQALPSSHSNPNAANIFASSGAAKTTAPPSFNFNSGSTTNSQSTVPSTNNIFAPPPSNITTGPGDRPFRRATRRLQK